MKLFLILFGLISFVLAQIGFHGYTTYSGYISNSYCQEAVELFDRMDEQPDATRKSIINTLIVSLKADGIWAKADAIYLFAAHSEQASLLNIVGESYTAIKSNAPIFTIDRGWKGAGGSEKILTQYTPSINAEHYQLESASAAVYCRTFVSGEYAARANGASGNLKIRPEYSSGYFLGQINDNGWDNINISGNTGLGLFEVKRTGGNKMLVMNGVVQKTIARDAEELPTVVVSMFDNSTATEVSFFYIGDYLTDTESLSLFNDVETYLDAIGAGVVN